MSKESVFGLRNLFLRSALLAGTIVLGSGDVAAQEANMRNSFELRRECVENSDQFAGYTVSRTDGLLLSAGFPEGISILGPSFIPGETGIAFIPPTDDTERKEFTDFIDYSLVREGEGQFLPPSSRSVQILEGKVSYGEASKRSRVVFMDNLEECNPPSISTFSDIVID